MKQVDKLEEYFLEDIILIQERIRKLKIRKELLKEKHYKENKIRKVFDQSFKRKIHNFIIQQERKRLKKIEREERKREEIALKKYEREIRIAKLAETIVKNFIKKYGPEAYYQYKRNGSLPDIISRYDIYELDKVHKLIIRIQSTYEGELQKIENKHGKEAREAIEKYLEMPNWRAYHHIAELLGKSTRTVYFRLRSLYDRKNGITVEPLSRDPEKLNILDKISKYGKIIRIHLQTPAYQCNDIGFCILKFQKYYNHNTKTNNVKVDMWSKIDVKYVVGWVDREIKVGKIPENRKRKMIFKEEDLLNIEDVFR